MAYRQVTIEEGKGLIRIVEVGECGLYLLRTVYCSLNAGATPNYGRYAGAGERLRTDDEMPNIGRLIELLEQGRIFTEERKPHIRRINPETGHGGRLALNKK